ARDQVADILGAEAAALAPGDLPSDVVEAVLAVCAFGHLVQQPGELNVALALPLDQPRWIQVGAFLHLPGQSDARRQARPIGHVLLQLVEGGRKRRHCFVTLSCQVRPEVAKQMPGLSVADWPATCIPRTPGCQTD